MRAISLAIGFISTAMLPYPSFGNPPFSFVTVGLEEFRREYTENGRLFHGTTHRNAASVSEAGRIEINPARDFM